MNNFDPHSYAPQIAELLLPERLNELGPGRPNASARKQLEALRPDDLAALPPGRDLQMAQACCAALWLYHDFLDQSHQISQEIDTATGSYWHGIMHRREPDAGNARYWFRRVGQRHPVFAQLGEQAHALARNDAPQISLASHFASGEWEPFRFIDLCEQVRGTGLPEELLCRRIALAEWRLLFDYCWRG
jgi:hypothetical protein